MKEMIANNKIILFISFMKIWKAVDKWFFIVFNDVDSKKLHFEN